MARVRFPGMKDYMEKIYALEENTVPIIKGAVYDGAREIADAVKANLAALETTTDLEVIKGWRKNPKDN